MYEISPDSTDTSDSKIRLSLARVGHHCGSRESRWLKRRCVGSVVIMAAVAILVGGIGFTGTAVADGDADELTECTVIDESGSYVLEDDLLVDGDDDTECLRIEASDVSIDGQDNEIRTDSDSFNEADGIEVADGTSDVLIENVEFQDLERGIDVRETEDLTVRDNVFVDGSDEAIDINADVTDVTIEGNEVDSWDGGVIVGASPTSIDHLEIRGNTFEGMEGVFTSPEETVFIASNDVEDAVIEDNEFLDSDQTSIRLEETENVQIRNNEHVGIESSTVIDVSAGTDIEITDETIDSEGLDERYAIRVTGSSGFSPDPSTNVAVTDSEVTDLQGTAIEVREAAEETHLAGNELTDVEHGIVVEGEETTIEDTVIEETTDSDGTQLPGLVFEPEAGPVAVSNTTLDGIRLDGTFADVSVNEFADALEDESAFEGLDEPLDPPEEGESAGVYFNQSSSSADGSWADLALNYTTADTDGLDESELKILQYDYETGNWDIISDEDDIDTDEQVVSANATGVGTVALYAVETVPPDASFEVDPAPPATPGEGDEVTFNASASTSPNGEIAEYRWDFADDGSVDETTADPVANYTYDDAGEYEVTLTIEDEAGETNETSFALTVTEVPQNGSEEFPYLIENVEDLQAMNEDLEGHYELVDDINASETDDWDDGSGFDPVGQGEFQPGLSNPDTDGSFVGTLDGQGYTISDLVINRTDQEGVGLFGGAYEATIEDVHFDTVEIRGEQRVGTLLGLGMNVTVHDSSVTGGEEATVQSGDNRVGGMVGEASNNASAPAGETGSGESVLTDIDVDVTVTSDERRVGGIVGLLRESELRDSTASGTITYFEDPSSAFGGAVGRASRALIENVSTTTDVDVRIPHPPDEDHFSSGGEVGGVVGEAGGSDIVASSASGTMEGRSSVGGLVGNNGNITDSYATGDVSATRTRAGGLVGRTAGTVEDSNATGSVSAGPRGNGDAGGLVGRVSPSPNALVTNSYATGDVLAEAEAPRVGGLVGTTVGEIHQSKANGTVSADGITTSERAYAGGLVGSVGSRGKINQSYATGERVLVGNGTRVGGLAGEVVDTSDNTDINVEESYAAVTVETINVDSTGGFVGSITGDIERSYWDVPESELEVGGAGTGDQNLTGLGELGDAPPAAEMTGDDAIGNMSDFDFENVWETTDEYPTLQGLGDEDPVELDPVGDFENAPTDQNGDGLYRDINGDGSVDVADVQALYAHLDDPTIENNVEKFDFADTGDVSILDVQALFAYVTQGNNTDDTTTRSLSGPGVASVGSTAVFGGGGMVSETQSDLDGRLQTVRDSSTTESVIRSISPEPATVTPPRTETLRGTLWAPVLSVTGGAGT